MEDPPVGTRVPRAPALALDGRLSPIGVFDRDYPFPFL